MKRDYHSWWLFDDVWRFIRSVRRLTTILIVKLWLLLTRDVYTIAVIESVKEKSMRDDEIRTKRWLQFWRLISLEEMTKFNGMKFWKSKSQQKQICSFPILLFCLLYCSPPTYWKEDVSVFTVRWSKNTWRETTTVDDYLMMYEDL